MRAEESGSLERFSSSPPSLQLKGIWASRIKSRGETRAFCAEGWHWCRVLWWFGRVGGIEWGNSSAVYSRVAWGYHVTCFQNKLGSGFFGRQAQLKNLWGAGKQLAQQGNYFSFIFQLNTVSIIKRGWFLIHVKCFCSVNGWRKKVSKDSCLMVEPLLCVENLAFVSLCFRNLFLVGTGKMNAVVQGTNKVFWVVLYSSSHLYSTKDWFGKWRTTDELGIWKRGWKA